METIEKVNAIISIVAEFTDEDANNLIAARDRIEKAGGEAPTEQDKLGLTRLDSILALYSTLPKEK